MNLNMIAKIIKTRHYVTIDLIDCYLILIFKAIEASNVETIAMLRLSINIINIILNRKNLMFINHFQIIFNVNLIIHRVMFIKIINILNNNDLSINQTKTIKVISIIKVKTALINRVKIKVKIKINKINSINI